MYTSDIADLIMKKMKRKELSVGDAYRFNTLALMNDTTSFRSDGDNYNGSSVIHTGMIDLFGDEITVYALWDAGTDTINLDDGGYTMRKVVPDVRNGIVEELCKANECSLVNDCITTTSKSTKELFYKVSRIINTVILIEGLFNNKVYELITGVDMEQA